LGGTFAGSDRGLLLQREVTGVVKARLLDTERVTGGLKLSEIVARGWER
jgi:hypothetical protein